MAILDNAYYQPGDQQNWQGRIDGTEQAFLRWHQVVDAIDLSKQQSLDGAFVILGFCCEEGVRRNQGRIGAKEGPAAFRKVLAGLPVHFSNTTRLIDAGDVICANEKLEEAQGCLHAAVNKIISMGGFPVLLGGGHEITYPHYLGLQTATKQSVGIINIDAHLDIRPLVAGKGNSGTGFYQIAQHVEKENLPFHYLAIGIQEISNTKALFDYADAKGVEIIQAKDIYTERLGEIIDQIIDFGKKVDQVYLTIDLDAFAAAYAPGVSALAFNGIVPDHNFHLLFETIIQLSNLVSIDIAELNPLFDIDNRTTKLGADLLFKLLQK